MAEYVIEMFSVSLLLTLGVELAAAAVFGFRTAKSLILVVLVNVLTNPPAVLLHWLCRLYMPKLPDLFVQLVIEAAVVASEALVYLFFSKDERWPIGHPVLYAVTANGCSWLLGVLISHK